MELSGPRLHRPLSIFDVCCGCGRCSWCTCVALDRQSSLAGRVSNLLRSTGRWIHPARQYSDRYPATAPVDWGINACGEGRMGMLPLCPLEIGSDPAGVHVATKTGQRVCSSSKVSCACSWVYGSCKRFRRIRDHFPGFRQQSRIQSEQARIITGTPSKSLCVTAPKLRERAKEPCAMPQQKSTGQRDWLPASRRHEQDRFATFTNGRLRVGDDGWCSIPNALFVCARLRLPASGGFDPLMPVAHAVES
jgi:hypothetical protein